MKLSELITKFDNLDKQESLNAHQVLTKDQAYIFKDIFKNYNNGQERYAVLDAKSGSGKTTLIRAMIKYAETNTVKLAITASTGKAASALGGKTIHSFLGLKMVVNDNAETKDEALNLTSDISVEVEIPDILIIDEASMIGKKVFSSIEKARFPFVLFVLDSSQLPPVKEKKVDWSSITSLQYTLTKTLRAKDERLMQLFHDFREYKNGIRSDLNLHDYINGDNIVSIDYQDLDYIPANSECCAVGYRNKLVEFLVDEITHKDHTLYNLNNGVSVTNMVAKSDIPNASGYFDRDFIQEQVYYNGEDVFIEKMHDKTAELVKKGYCFHNGYRLSLHKKKTGITISAHQSASIPYGAKESRENKKWLGFPADDVVENCTLACINNEHYVLLWDGTEDEHNDVLEKYFILLSPHLKITRAIKAYYKDKNSDIKCLPYEIAQKIKTTDRRTFSAWFATTEETYRRNKRWKDFLSAKSVISARQTTARTIHKSQGISVPAVIITDYSFYGASLDAQYVASTRMKQGLILVHNVPDEWKTKEEDEFE